MTHDDKRYRECVAEIEGVLKKYDMAGAITVVAQNRCMFKYVFPTWSCIRWEGPEKIRFRALRKDYPSDEAQREAIEASAHIVMQFGDIAAQTIGLCTYLKRALEDKFDIEHKSYADFDPELPQ